MTLGNRERTPEGDGEIHRAALRQQNGWTVKIRQHEDVPDGDLSMNTDERWSHLIALDEELLGGGVLLSEWCSFIVREADIAFVNGAHLATILTAVSGIETYLRSEYAARGRDRLVALIDHSPVSDNLKADLHTLRKYRNLWVHVDDPWCDRSLIEKPEEMERELESMAFFAARVLRRTIYENQWT